VRFSSSDYRKWQYENAVCTIGERREIGLQTALKIHQKVWGFHGPASRLERLEKLLLTPQKPFLHTALPCKTALHPWQLGGRRFPAYQFDCQTQVFTSCFMTHQQLGS
jgi:hypothetical protein